MIRAQRTNFLVFLPEQHRIPQWLSDTNRSKFPTDPAGQKKNIYCLCASYSVSWLSLSQGRKWGLIDMLALPHLGRGAIVDGSGRQRERE